MFALHWLGYVAPRQLIVESRSVSPPVEVVPAGTLATPECESHKPEQQEDRSDEEEEVGGKPKPEDENYQE